MSGEKGHISYASDDLILEHVSSSGNDVVDGPTSAVLETSNRNAYVRSNTLNQEEILNPSAFSVRNIAWDLLALGDGTENVCTGVSEEIILTRLKQQKYKTSKISPQVADPCCICQEEYTEEENMGILECGHNFHTQCIKEWLKRKNICPICKATGLNIVKNQKME